MTLDIQFLIPGLAFSGDALDTQSLGGSETAGLCLAREMAKLGHAVRVFCNTPKPGVYDKVEYRVIQEWPVWSQRNPHDVAIVQRAPEAFATTLSSKLNYLWCHDLALRRQAGHFKAAMWNVDRVVVLSDYMRQQYKDVYGLPDDVFYQTRNGIDRTLIDSVPGVERVRNRLLYISRPERGLDVLLQDIMPLIKAKRPDVSLAICTYDNPAGLPPDFMAKINAAIENLGVENLGHLTKRELYAEMKRCAALVYPTPSPVSPEFREVSCIAVMEAQACGLPVITSRNGALPETCPGGAVVDGVTGTSGYAQAFAARVLEVLDDNQAWTDLSRAGQLHVVQSGYNWAAIAQDWIAQIQDDLAVKSADPVRNAAWLHKRSDYETAKLAIADHDGADAGHIAHSVAADMATNYTFLESEEAFIAHYQGMGDGTDADLAAKDDAGKFPREFIVNNPQPRFQQILGALSSFGIGPEHSVLDYGCGHGWSPLFIAGNLGCRVTGFDLDQSAMRWCNHFAPRVLNDDVDRAKFTSVLNETGTGHDALVCSEVLEHVLNWRETIERAERRVKIGGLVVITVPYGPWEFDGPNWHGPRAHIREFNAQDLREAFGKKPGFKLSACCEASHPKLTDGLGYYLVTYLADHLNVGAVDAERKLATVAPRQTLSVNIIAGPGCENTLRWCLESVQSIANEIIIGDTGMSPTAQGIAREFGCVLVAAPDPKQYGFDEARNVPLRESSGDWILWIDTDERLTNPQAVLKYLRQNMFDGYSVKQHHFAVDTAFPPDVPVRLFRNKRGLRFFGSIHEHPERELNEGPGIVCLTNDLSIAHVGYLSEGVRMGRFVRNSPLMELDAQKYPNRVLRKFLQMRDNQIRCGAILSQTRAVVPEVRALCEETIRLYRENFIDGQKLYGIDARPQYSNAVEILGEGFRAKVDIRANKMGVGDPCDDGMFFANEEDFAREVKRIAGQKTEMVAGDFW